MGEKTSQTPLNFPIKATFQRPCFTRRNFGYLTLLIATSAGSTQAFAHGAERGLIMLLPTQFYLTGGGLAVLLSFLLLTVAPTRWFAELPRKTFSVAQALSVPKAPLSLLSFAILGVSVVAGFLSVDDPLSNPLPLLIWTVGWVGLTMLQAILGNLWPWLNPWTGVLSALRRVSGTAVGREPIMALPSAIGYVPAILQFSGFAWFELVSIAPEDPTRLAMAVSSYWAINFAAMIVFGERAWMRVGEPFSIFFRMIGLFSVFSITTDGHRKSYSIGWPGARCLSAETLPLSGTIFILLTLGTATFDGFSETFTWLGFIDVNPLEFPGRSGVMIANSFGLLITPIVLMLVFYLSVAAGLYLAGKGWSELQHLAGRLVYSIVPISIAFHCAHYLTQLLINGQYLMVVISDPFALGWDLFGTVDMHVTASFLQNLEGVRIIWTAQTLIIVMGHVAGIVVAHAIAADVFRSSKAAARSQIFLAVAMVIYTVFGLWLLSTPSVG